MFTIVKCEGKQTSLPAYYYKLFLAMSRKDRERIAALKAQAAHYISETGLALERAEQAEADNARLRAILGSYKGTNLIDVLGLLGNAALHVPSDNPSYAVYIPAAVAAKEYVRRIVEYNVAQSPAALAQGKE